MNRRNAPFSLFRAKLPQGLAVVTVSVGRPINEGFRDYWFSETIVFLEKETQHVRHAVLFDNVDDDGEGLLSEYAMYWVRRNLSARVDAWRSDHGGSEFDYEFEQLPNPENERLWLAEFLGQENLGVLRNRSRSIELANFAKRIMTLGEVREVPEWDGHI